MMLAATVGFLALAAAGDDAAFRERVAPILERRCVGCHSAANPKGKLSLASAEAVRRGGEGGPAVEPGKPDESLLLEKLTGTKPAMPRNAPALAPAEVAAIRVWIESGAPWPEGLVLKDRKFDGETWWSLRPLRRPGVPSTKLAGWARTPIDAFLLAALEAKGLSPSPEADRRTLIRRVTFDLTGLPPSPEEVEAFAGDTSPDAYEKVVDCLLALPAYGERWARHWLDLAHYGDTHGYDKDKRRDHAWPYRDYVIDALNRDTPYARFVEEQLAGDVLFPGDPRGVVATGFIAAGPWDFVGHVELREGTVEKEKTRLLDRDDMVTTAVTTFSSLTIHCARCHDHKFDPIPQNDYYRLQAVFAGVERGDRSYDEPDVARRRVELAAHEAKVKARRAGLVRSIADARLRDEIERLATPRTSSPSNGYHSRVEPSPDVTKWVQVDLGRSIPLESIRLVPARPVDFPDTPGFGFPARYRVEVSDDPSFRNARRILDRTEADAANPGDAAMAIAIPAGTSARFVRMTATKLWPRTNDYVFALAELEAISEGANVAAGADVSALDSIEGGLWSRSNLVDGFDSRRPLAGRDATSLPASLRRRLETALGRTEAERMAEEWAESARSLAAIESERAALPAPKRVYSALPRVPRPIAVLKRGEVEQPGESVGPGALSCVAELPAQFDVPLNDEGARRAALARWIVDPANPLTWRSIANRVWHYHFGRGIVDTPSDFGRNGSKPTHPELLDWLAAEFRDRGGSLKSLHRLIVTSAAYRQSSADRRDALAVDADNRGLWRMNRRRLDAEEVRDAVLAVAGTLDPARGGPGFEPFRFKDDHSPIYDHEDVARLLAPDCRRRSIYRFTVRSVPQPFLECMDAADPNQNVPVRSSTITALQALALWNDPFLLDQAGAFARRVGPDTDRIDAAVRLAFGRPARADERAALEDLALRRGMPAVCRLLFNANEFLFVD